MLRYGLLPLGCFCVCTSPALAADQDGLDLSGMIRLRYEVIGDQPRSGFNRDDDLASLRTILAAKYQSGPFTVAGELWDSRVYGENKRTPVTTGEVNTLEMVQAYVGVRHQSAAPGS